MKETTIIERTKIKKLRNCVLITGLPGIGLIGQVVGRYLVEELKAKRVANLLSPHFPHQVFMTKNGGMRLIRNSFFLFSGSKRDIIILVGDIQAMSSVGQYEIAGKVVEFAKKHDIGELLTIGGYSTGKVNDERRVFAVASSDKMRAKLKKHGVVFGEAKGSIVGAAGLIPAVGSYAGVETACIMGETHGGYVDTVSARKIVQLLSKYLDVPISLKRLTQRAEESEKIIKKVEDDIKKNMVAHFDQSSNNAASYIR